MVDNDKAAAIGTAVERYIDVFTEVEVHNKHEGAVKSIYFAADAFLEKLKEFGYEVVKNVNG